MLERLCGGVRPEFVVTTDPFVAWSFPVVEVAPESGIFAGFCPGKVCDPPRSVVEKLYPAVMVNIAFLIDVCLDKSRRRVVFEREHR